MDMSLILGSKARIRNTTKPRSLSAYPLGIQHPQPMVNRRQSNFSADRSFSTLDDGALSSFSVGPCYLIQRQRKPNYSKATLTMEDVLVPINEIDFVSKRGVGEDSQKESSRLSFANLGASICSTECDQNSQECSVDNSVKIVSFKGKIVKKGSSKHRTSQINHRKGKQKSIRTMPKPIVKHKSSKDYHNISSKRNPQAKHSSNKTTKAKAYQIFVTSNNIQPLLSASLPSIRASNQLSSSEMQNLSLKVSSHYSQDDLNKIGNIEKSSNHLTKVYLSEKQSRTMMGIPAVPPCTPYQDGACKIQFVPSMSDIKSQRFIVERLSHIWKKQSKKEHDEKLAKEHKRLREEKVKQRDFISNIKRRQRAEIYALNAVLSEIEKSTYEKFKEERGLPV